MNQFSCFLLLILFTFSCQTYSNDEKSKFDKKIETFLKKNKQKYIKSESGLYYFIESEGKGNNIKLTDEVTFIYEGRFLNGKMFDRKNKKNPVRFKVSNLILGWQEIMLYMKNGGKAKLVVPPQLAYGNYNLHDIPKNSVLLFQIEILEVN